MKIEEAVKILDPETTADALYGLPHDEAVALVEDACRLAVTAMREQAEEKTPCAACGYGGKHLDAPPCTDCPAHPKGAAENEPLTLEELREMTMRCEGVYVANIDGRPLFRERKYCAAVLDVKPAFGSSEIHIQAIYGDKLSLWEDDYGKTWVAYSRPPEKEES